MHVVHGIAGIARSSGGTSTLVVELVDALALVPGNRVSLITSPGAAGDVPVNPAVHIVPAASPAAFGAAAKRLHATASIDVIHAHGLWQRCSHDLGRAARDLNVPFVLATHGMLQPDALRLKRFRKLIALAAYQRRDLVAADALHATARAEAATVRRFGLRQPIIVAPPGIDLPAEAPPQEREPDAPRTALFCSRLHPIKNLPGLIAAWAAVRPEGWRLVLAGPDDVGHGAEVRAAIRSAGLDDVVSIRGPAYGAEKESLFRAASLFILPSFTENFGIVVAEALAYGVPAIATTGSPWEELATRECGWWVDPSPPALAAAISAATRTDPATLAAMGRRGRALVAGRYQRSAIRDDVQAAYEWLLGRGPKPECVLA